MTDEVSTAQAIWRAIEDLASRLSTLERRIDTTANPPIPISFLVLFGMFFIYLVAMGFIVLYLAV